MGIGLFNFSTIQCSLLPKTKTMKMTLRKEAAHNLDNATLFEIDSLFKWLAKHIEVKSVFLCSEEEFFCHGPSKEILREMSKEKMLHLQNQIAELNHTMAMLPQTFILDYQKGASGLGIDLFLNADIKIADIDCEIHFNHLESGIAPLTTINELGKMVGTSKAKQWLLSGLPQKSINLRLSGLVTSTYETETRFHLLNEHLFAIHNQSTVTRIQTKLGLSMLEQKDWEKDIVNTFKTVNAAYSTEEWKGKFAELNQVKESAQLHLVSAQE